MQILLQILLWIIFDMVFACESLDYECPIILYVKGIELIRTIFCLHFREMGFCFFFKKKPAIEGITFFNHSRGLCPWWAMLTNSRSDSCILQNTLICSVFEKIKIKKWQIIKFNSHLNMNIILRNRPSEENKQ